tara:strand:+ start:326 stop:1324 length:999 start_codon:yes stop_codon:yes gene_type:complete
MTDHTALIAELQAWDKAGLIAPDHKSTIALLNADADPFVVSCVHSKIKDTIADAVKEKELKAKLRDEKNEHIKQYDRDEICRWNELREQENKPSRRVFYKTYFPAIKQEDGSFIPAEKEVKVYKIMNSLPMEIAEIAIHDYFANRDKYVETKMSKKKSNKKSSGSKKEMKDPNAQEIVHPDFTKEIAIAKYETEKGFVLDGDQGETFCEKKKYEKGKKNPIDGTILEDNIYLLKYKPLIKPTSFCDLDDPDRCQAAVAWKPMSYGSKFAKTNGFIGDAKVMCDQKVVAGQSFCKKCQGKPLFVDYTYKKLQKKASSFYTDENVIYLDGTGAE